MRYTDSTAQVAVSVLKHYCQERRCLDCPFKIFTSNNTFYDCRLKLNIPEEWEIPTCKPENSPVGERTTDKGMFIPSAPNEAETGDFSAKEALAEIGKAFVKFGEAIDKEVNDEA